MLILEECAHSLLSLVDIFKIRLGVGLLGLSLFQKPFECVALCDGIYNSFNVIYLSFTPVVHMIKRVLLIIDHMLHLLLETVGLRVIQNEEILLSLSVCGHIEVFVLVDESLQHSVVAD